MEWALRRDIHCCIQGRKRRHTTINGRSTPPPSMPIDEERRASCSCSRCTNELRSALLMLDPRDHSDGRENIEEGLSLEVALRERDGVSWRARERCWHGDARLLLARRRSLVPETVGSPVGSKLSSSGLFSGPAARRVEG